MNFLSLPLFFLLSYLILLLLLLDSLFYCTALEGAFLAVLRLIKPRESRLLPNRGEMLVCQGGEPKFFVLWGNPGQGSLASFCWLNYFLIFVPLSPNNFCGHLRSIQWIFNPGLHYFSTGHESEKFFNEKTSRMKKKKRKFTLVDPHYPSEAQDSQTTSNSFSIFLQSSSRSFLSSSRALYRHVAPQEDERGSFYVLFFVKTKTSDSLGRSGNCSGPLYTVFLCLNHPRFFLFVSYHFFIPRLFILSFFFPSVSLRSPSLVVSSFLSNILPLVLIFLTSPSLARKRFR